MRFLILYLNLTKTKIEMIVSALLLGYDTRVQVFHYIIIAFRIEKRTPIHLHVIPKKID